MATKFDFLSPGINIREIDQSFIPQEQEAAGPIIIGRTRKGPANKPVRVRNLDDFVSVFGLPVAGGNGSLGDVWREGNTVGPTYASYAAQSWLASENSPVTIVRVAGEQHSSATAAGYAGWEVGSGGIATTGVSTAYGLFLVDEGDSGDYTYQTITIAGTGMSDTQKITINDNVNTAVVLEFDNDDTVTGSNVSIAFTGTAAQIAARLADAIEAQIAAGSLNAIVSYDAGETVIKIALTHSTSGTLATTATDVSVSSGTLDGATIGTVSNGALAAVLYCTTGALALKGTLADGSSANTIGAGTLIQSQGTGKEFKLLVYDENGTEVDNLDFNFTRNSPKYIRSVLNTNPQLTNSDTNAVASTDQKKYFLGESFADHLESNVSSSVAGETYAVLLPLGKSTAATTNWGYHRYGAREAKSGWVFSDRSTSEKKLFRFKSLHVGTDIQNNYLIAIEQIKTPSNPNVDAYASFTVCFKDVQGNTVERFTGCNLNPSSPNYIAARIGDQYQEWSDSDKRYRTYGDFQNQSNLFYVEVSENIANGGSQGFIPAGFYGPVRPKGFTLVEGQTTTRDLSGANDFTGSIVVDSRNSVLYKGHADSTSFAELGTREAASFEFPKLRMRNNGSDGGAADQARSYWGIRPKISANSTQHDPDYADYLRPLGMGLGEEATHQTFDTDLFEYSFIFSLDDVSGSSVTNVWSWASGNFGNAVGAVAGDGASFTSKAANTFETLLDAGVRQFVMPVWGGSDGFDIKEMEPLRNELISTTAFSETTNYVDYSISKALDSISDSEVVPANLLVAPGLFKPSVTNKMINVAETRKDVLAIIDLQGDYRPRVELNDTAQNRLGSVTTAISNLKSRNLNSSYACAFYPSVQVSDNLNAGQLVWIPASVAALGAFGKSQAQSELWFAPAGFNRGGLGNLGGARGPRVIQARQRLDSKERDLLYEQNINPIATFPAEGVVIFGQKTLQADQSALDRINVRRLLLYLKAQVSNVARNLLFDQNVQSTWNRFKSQVNPILSDTRARFGLSDYKLILDDTTTTADLVDRNIMYAKIYIKPARAIEYIVVDFVITRTGADFV